MVLNIIDQVNKFLITYILINIKYVLKIYVYMLRVF